MVSYYDFQSEKDPALHGFTDDPTGAKLPEEDGPWSLVRQVEPDDRWIYPVTRAVVQAGVLENGFLLWEPTSKPVSSKPVIESDRVEGTAVYSPDGAHVGTIKRLMIEKISGKVAYAVMSFGGFLGLGADEHIIPWAKLDYDTSLGGYRTDITEEQLRGAPTFYRDEDYDWRDRDRERGLFDYYGVPYYWGI